MKTTTEPSAARFDFTSQAFKENPFPTLARMRGPSFYNISLLGETSKGLLIGDLIALMGSIDITLGECDR